MSRKSVLKCMISIAIVVVLAFNIITYASTLGGNVVMTPNKTSVAPGDKVTVTFSINNLSLTDGSAGITMLSGVLNYDKDVFEELTEDDINPGDNRQATLSNDMILIEFKNLSGVYVAGGTPYFSITFTAKNNASFENTQISISDVEVTDNVDAIEPVVVPVIIEKYVEQNPTPTTSTPETTTPTTPTTSTPETTAPTTSVPETTTPGTNDSPSPKTSGSTINIQSPTNGTSINSPKATTATKTTTTANNQKQSGSLPQTGLNNTVLIGLIAGSVGIFGFSLYKYIKMKDLMK